MAQFSWAAAADVGMGLANAIGAWGTAKANKIVAKANAEAANTVRKAQNEERASALTLAASMRAMAQRSALTNAGDAYGDATELIARTQESVTRGQLDAGIRSQEQLGALAARAAASGVGGASVQAVSYSMRLQQARLAEVREDRADQLTYELTKQRAGIMPAAVSRLDVSPLAAGFDYSRNMPQGGNSANLATALIQGLLSKSKSLQVALDSIAQDQPATPAPVIDADAEFAALRID